MKFLKKIGFLFVLALSISTLLVSCGKGAIEDVEPISKTALALDNSIDGKTNLQDRIIGSGPVGGGSSCFRGTLLINEDCEWSWPITYEVVDNEDFPSHSACITWGWQRKAELEAQGHCVVYGETHCNAVQGGCRS